MAEETPEDRLNVAIAAVTAAGGTIIAQQPYAPTADAAAPTAYAIKAGLPGGAMTAKHPAILAALTAHEVDLTGLVPWTGPVEASDA